MLIHSFVSTTVTGVLLEKLLSEEIHEKHSAAIQSLHGAPAVLRDVVRDYSAKLCPDPLRLDRWYDHRRLQRIYP